MVRRVCAESVRGASGECPTRVNEVLLERPERCGGTAADSGLLVDVLHVVAHGLDRDAEILGDPLIRLAAHQNQQDFELALGQSGR